MALGARRRPHPHLPALRGDVRAARPRRGRPRGPHPRQSRRRLEPRLSCARRAPRSASCITIRTGCARRCVRDGDGLREVGWAEAFREVARRLRPVIAEHGIGAVTRVHRQPDRPQLLARALRAGLRGDVGAAGPVLGGHGRPVAEESQQRADVRRHVDDPGARPRPHAVPADARREPARLAGQPARGGRRARAARRDSRARRPRGGRGPAPHRHGRSRRRMAPDPARHGRRTSARDRARALRRGPRAARASRSSRERAWKTCGASPRTFRPNAWRDACGVPAETIRRLARELSEAPRAAVYGRIGTCNQEFGTLASWLVDVLNVLTGNLDREGGAMFSNPVAWSLASLTPPEFANGFTLRRWRSRVRGAPEVLGQVPISCLAEEIATPGKGQIRALITIAGNPVISAPDAAKLDAALPGARFHAEHRQLAERDHAPRGRDPARPVGARAAALRRADLVVGGAQRRQVLGAALRPGRAAARVGDPAHARGDPARRRPGCDRRARARPAVLRRSRGGHRAGAGLADPRARSGRDRRRDRGRRPRAPARLRDPHRPVGRRVWREPGRPHARRAEARAERHRPAARSSRASTRC